MKIFRYPLGITDHQILDLPFTSILLSVAPGRMMPGMPTAAEHIDLWALVPQEAPPVPYHIWIIGTGNPVPKELNRLGMTSAADQFIGTCAMPSGYVWHVFWTPTP
jgi:hypothetical protein